MQNLWPEKSKEVIIWSLKETLAVSYSRKMENGLKVKLEGKKTRTPLWNMTTGHSRGGGKEGLNPTW